MSKTHTAKFTIGQVVKHRLFSFRGVIFDIDPVFNNTEEWWEAIPADVRPRKDQPFYHLFAENAETEYIAYVSEQNLLPDTSGAPIRHPQVDEVFEWDDSGGYRPLNGQLNYAPRAIGHKKGAAEAAPFAYPIERPVISPEPEPATALPASCAPLRPSSAVLPAACAAAPRTLSDRSPGRHRPWRNRRAAAAG